MAQFLQICLGRAGADSMITPREMLRDYMTVLNILMQNPEATFEEVVGSAVTLRTDADSEDSETQSSSDESTRRAFTVDDIEF
jgi:hypothetical protein